MEIKLMARFINRTTNPNIRMRDLMINDSVLVDDEFQTVHEIRKDRYNVIITWVKGGEFQRNKKFNKTYKLYR